MEIIDDIADIAEKVIVGSIKSPIEREKREDAENSIVDAINKAMFVLNDTGKNRVLQKLSKKPDEKFENCIDSAGNVDTSSIFKTTTKIIKLEIKEAEKEGLDLRRNHPVSQDNSKDNTKDGVLTASAIDNMINNFENLSAKDRTTIINNWGMLSNSQRAIIAGICADELHQAALKTTNEKNGAILEEASQAMKQVREESENGTTISEEEINYWANLSIGEIKKIPELQGFSDFLLSKYKGARLEDLIKEPEKLVKRIHEFVDCNLALAYTRAKREADEHGGEYTEQGLMDMQDAVKKRDDIRHFRITKGKNVGEIMSSSKVSSKLGVKTHKGLTKKNINTRISSKLEIKTLQRSSKTNINTKIAQEIEQLPSALTNAGFSQEDISEGLKNYKNFFEQLEEDDIAYLSELSTSKLSETLTSEFEEMEINQNSKEILKIMSNITFNGRMQQILTNSELREQFLAHFDKVIEQGINLEQNIKLTDELSQIFSQYFQDSAVDMNVSAIEFQKEQITNKQTQQEEPKEHKLSETPVPESKMAPEEHTQGNIPENEHSETYSQDMAMVKQDNSFIGKIKRVFANMRDMKNKDSSKGFFTRLGMSIQTVFGKEKEEYYTKQDDNISKVKDEVQPIATSQSINYLTQHIDINTQEAIRKTIESNKDKATDKEITFM